MNKDTQDNLVEQEQKPNESEALEELTEVKSPAPNGNGHTAAPEVAAEAAAEETKAGAAADAGGNGDSFFDDSHAEEAAVEEGAKKSKLFSRRKSASAELEKLKVANEKLVSENEGLKDRYLRLAAEMENFRKRTDRDFQNRLQHAFAGLITDLLPIIDDLERPLQTKDESRDYENLLNGMQLIHQKFVKVLEERGVKAMKTLDAEFNPVFHQAVSERAVAGKPGGLVVDELQRGYLFNERVLRAAQVIVSKENSGSENEAA